MMSFCKSSMLSLVSWYFCLKIVSSQTKNIIYAKLHDTINMAFPVPLAYNEIVLVNHRDSGNGVIITKDERVIPKDLYKDRISSLYWDKKDNIKYIKATMKNVDKKDAGTYICTRVVGTEIGGCELKVIIVLKPGPPSISQLSTPLTGRTLHLRCYHNSLSLPKFHGLLIRVYWLNAMGEPIGEPESDKYTTDGEDNLQVHNVKREDLNLEIFCKSADRAPGLKDSPISDISYSYKLIPEYPPELEGIKFTPTLAQNAKVIKKEKEEIIYDVEADCSPICMIIWNYTYPMIGQSIFLPMKDTSHFKLQVFRNWEGQFFCIASNEHGQSYKTFSLEVLYVELPKITIDSKATNVEIEEGTIATLTCEVDALPSPQIKLIYASRVVVDKQTKNPKIEIADTDDVLHHFHSITHRVDTNDCGSIQTYSCEAFNEVSTVESAISYRVWCHVSFPDVEDGRVQPVYNFTLKNPLTFTFVLRGYPEPNATKVTSELHGIVDEEILLKDVEIKSEGHYKHSHCLTIYRLAFLRKLHYADSEKRINITFDNFLGFSFLIYTEIPLDITTTPMTTEIEAITHKKEQQEESHSAMWLAGVFIFLVVTAVVMVIILLMKKKPPESERTVLSAEDIKVAIKPSPSGHLRESIIQ